MALLKQSTNRTRVVLMVLSSDHVTGATGKTLTITLSKNGAAAASVSPTVTELDSGRYAVAWTTAHSNTLGDFIWHVTAPDCDPVDVEDEVVADLPGATVASVTGAVGSVTGTVASVTGAVGSVTGNVGGNVVGDVQGSVRLSAAGVADILNWAGGIESFAADGAVPTPFQLLLMIWLAIAEASKAGATVTVRRLDGSTPAMTFTLNDPTNPTSVTRAS